MTPQKSPEVCGPAGHNFLKMASMWFDHTFEYRNVAKWCNISQKQGRMILNDLISSGLVEVDADGVTKLTRRGKSASRIAA